MTQCKVKEISPTLFEIPELGHTVKIQKKPGRTLWLCSCQNHQKFCNENGWCFDKQLVSEYLTKKPIIKEFNKLIEKYKSFSGINAEFKAEVLLDELNTFFEKFLK